VSARPDVRGGRATRGFPPGSAQALVALVLGVVAGVAGIRRDEPLWAAVFFAVALLGAAGLLRLLQRHRRSARRSRSGGGASAL
jgi:hypothetical protein